MKKSYNDIKAQEQRVIAMCKNSGRYCDNAKKRLDIQHIAQITRHALTQHGFPVFGVFDKDEKRDRCDYLEKYNIKPDQAQPGLKQITIAQPTPTERARQMVSFNDWMDADEAHRKHIQDGVRHAFVVKMYAELLTDMEICRLENWDILEFPRMLKNAIAVCFPKQPKQLTLFE